MIGLLLTAQLMVVAHAPDTATSCAPIELSVAARAPGNVAPRIAPLLSAGAIQVLKSSMSTRIERDAAGRPSALTELTYLITTDAVGRITVPSFVATVGNARMTSQPLPIDVHSAGNLPPTVIVRAWLDRSSRGGPSDTLFVGQQVDYVVDVQLNESARNRLRRNPTFFPPEMPGVLAYDLAPPTSFARAGRRCFETLSYRRALFPLFAGRTAIAPAALTYALPLSTSFFSREETFELRTDSVRFVAIDVPVEGRPADFAGAVGALSASARLSTTSARMGDPVVLTLRLEGSGNVKLWPRPPLSLTWASVAQGGERVIVDTSQARVRGSKEFDWLLTPRQAGSDALPPIRYPYFDAERRVYETAVTAPLSLDVVKASLASVDSAPVSKLGIRRTLREEVPPPIPSRPWFWLALVVAPVPAAIRSARERARRRVDRRSAIRRLKRSATRSEKLTAREVRRIFIDAIGERVPDAVGKLQSATLSRALRRNGVTVNTADDVGAFLERLDSAAFSPAGAAAENVLADAWRLVNAIDEQALYSGKRARWFEVMAIVSLVAIAAASALPDGVENVFKQGVEAYDHAAYTSAQRNFSRVVSRVPRAVDGWANLGASAWARGDSAGAVRGWQRALRLDPLDVETRDRLALVQVPSIRAQGYVPPMPVNMLAIAALVFWCAPWALLVVAPAKRPANARALAGGSIALAGVLLAGALEMRDRLDTAGLGVLRDSRVLVEAPGSQTALASGSVGETGALGAREGGWVRIALDGVRAGWVPVTSVLPLDGPSLDD
ncbi:MAG: BatD family protein [Gemmatimonadota bacterium]